VWGHGQPRLPFSERTVLLKELYDNGVPPNVRLVPTVLVENEAEVMLARDLDSASASFLRSSWRPDLDGRQTGPSHS
jgi:hypothetical protein